MQQTTIATPPHFDPANAATWAYTPDEGNLARLAPEWAKQFGVTSAVTDDRKVHLLIIDAQQDFTNPEGTLFVGGRSGTGAIDDCARTAEFIYANLGHISQITATLDTHVPHQIFFPGFWVDSSGSHPAEHTVITAAEVINGTYAPDPAMAGLLSGGDYPWLCAYAQHYCESLERAGKYTLYLWPYHCQIGSVGYALNGVVEEAAKFHAFARTAQMAPEIKGNSPFTECYSVLGPEVELSHDRRVIGQKNVGFIDTLLVADYVAIMGQAASHCVASSIDDFLTQIQAKDPDLARKVYVVRDCMSAVAVPDGLGGFHADFTPQAEAALDRFAAAGMHLVESTTPLVEWPDIKL